MRLIKGDELSAEQRREVLSAYVHRHLDTTSKTDADWLAKHAFYITRAGRLARNRRHCEPAFMAEPERCSAGVVGCRIFFDTHGHTEGEA